jgi:prevent-host-death family protein
MNKSIKVGDLRRNSADMINDVQNGDEYVVTNHGREVARVVPIADDTRWIHNRDRVTDVLRTVSSTDLAALVDEGRRAEMGAVL